MRLAEGSRDGLAEATPPEHAQCTGPARCGPRPSRIPPRRVWWIFLALLLGNWLVTKFLFPDAEAPVTVPYTVFKEQVAQGNVKAIYSQGVSIEGKFSNPVAWAPADAASAAAPPRPARTFMTTLPAFVDQGLESFLIGHQVEISAVPIRQGSAWSSFLLGFGPAVLIIAFYVWLYRRASQQGGDSAAR
jgi:cell division protease FtsH